MGLFVQRPEEPSEWAGLPGEPARPRTRAEVLPDGDAATASPTALPGFTGSHVTSIAIPLDGVVGAADGSAGEPAADPGAADPGAGDAAAPAAAAPAAEDE